MFVSAQTESNTLCKSNEIACKDQTQCVLKSFLCDKEFDCNDRSDEIGCGKRFQCFFLTTKNFFRFFKCQISVAKNNGATDQELVDRAWRNVSNTVQGGGLASSVHKLATQLGPRVRGAAMFLDQFKRLRHFDGNRRETQ